MKIHFTIPSHQALRCSFNVLKYKVTVSKSISIMVVIPFFLSFFVSFLFFSFFFLLRVLLCAYFTTVRMLHLHSETLFSIQYNLISLKVDNA